LLCCNLWWKNTIINCNFYRWLWWVFFTQTYRRLRLWLEDCWWRVFTAGRPSWRQPSNKYMACNRQLAIPVFNDSTQGHTWLWGHKGSHIWLPVHYTAMACCGRSKDAIMDQNSILIVFIVNYWNSVNVTCTLVTFLCDKIPGSCVFVIIEVFEAYICHVLV